MTKSNLEIAREILAAAQSDIRGTRGESYFTTDRGITLTPWPACLRFASKLTHPCEQSFPALVVEATDARTGQAPGSIQRIFLGWKRGKAQVDKPKMALGPMKGAVARLGESIDGQPLLIAEGVENAMTGMAASRLAGWATFGTAGLQGFNPPDTVKWVKALAVLAPAMAERGIRLDVVRPAPGLKDVNDFVNGTSGHTPEAGLAVVRALIEKAQASTASAASATGCPTGSGDSDDDEADKFSLTESGLYRRKGKKWQWLAQPFEVLGLARDDQDGDWGKLVRFRNPDGRVREEIIKTATLHDDPNAVISALAGHGMDIKCTAVARRSFAEYLAAVDAKERVTTARRIGWLEVGGRRVFVLPDEIIGGGADERIILAEGIGAPYGRRGTLEDWRNAIATPAGEHLILRLSLSTALAGPLLLLGGFESGVVHVHGSSTIGKTTALRTGASVWGSGVDGEYVRTWRSTANALEATLASACDTFLPLDEIGQADGREIGLALYMAASGSGKSRLRRDASLRPSHKWRTLILSSGETPIEAKLNEERRGPARAYAGHLVRAVDIKVERALGVFDRAYVDFDPKAFADQMKRAASTIYGTAGPEFVRQLIERQTNGELVRSRVAAFVENALAGVADWHGQAARAAERFGLIAVAGELAVEFGLVDWGEGQSTKDGLELFRAWLETRGGAAPTEVRQIIAQVRRFLEAHGDSRFDDLDPPRPNPLTGHEPERKPVVNRAGYRRGDGDDRRWLVLPEVWRHEICGGFDSRDVGKILVSLTMLECVAADRHTQSLRLPGAQKTQRFYVLTPAVFEGWGEAGDE